jgi:hypothetical protein
LERTIRASLAFAPIDLLAKEVIWLYLIRENIQAVDAGGSKAPVPYVVFTSGNVPYQGNARFNLAHWSYSNYL